MSLCSLVIRLSGIRVAIVDAEKLQDSRGTSATLGDRSFSLAIAKVDVDDAHGSQRLPRVFRGDVQLYRLEFLLQRSIQQEGQRSDEDMGVDSIGFLMEDGAHFDHIFKFAKGAFDFTEFLVDFDSLYRGDVFLLRLN